MGINMRSVGLVDNLNEFNYHILGCGAIGSAAATQLVRMGAENFCLYDNDVVDTGNVGVSQYTIYDVGHKKVDMLKSKILDVNNSAEVMCADEMFSNYIYMNDNDIIILGFDSMKSRLDAVKAITGWRQSSPLLLIDGRMGAEHYHQIVLEKPTLSKYIKHWYSDEEGDPEPCNAKATSYCSNMSGSFISDTIKKILTDSVYYKELSFHFPSLTMRRSGVIDRS